MSKQARSKEKQTMAKTVPPGHGCADARAEICRPAGAGSQTPVFPWRFRSRICFTCRDPDDCFLVLVLRARKDDGKAWSQRWVTAATPILSSATLRRRRSSITFRFVPSCWIVWRSLSGQLE